MPPFAYPITINYEKQLTRYTEKIKLPDNSYTINELSRYVLPNERFTIEYIQDSPFSYISVIYVERERIETNEERNRRVEKQERYMLNYHKFHANKG